jgi:hypothetical protein
MWAVPTDPPFLTSELNGGEWLASCPCRFTLEEKIPGTYWKEGDWVSELAWTSWKREKCISPAGNRTRLLVRPARSLVARFHYTANVPQEFCRCMMAVGLWTRIRMGNQQMDRPSTTDQTFEHLNNYKG